MENSNGGNTNVGSIGNSIKNGRSSIEEDIEILENLLEEGFEAMCYPEAQAIEHLIKAYKNLKEIEESHRNENGRLRERVKGLEENINKQKQLTKIAQTITDESIKEALIEFEKDYIPVSLVEEKIEELKEEIEQLRIEKNVTYDSGIYRNQIKIDILQELLESEE